MHKIRQKMRNNVFFKIWGGAGLFFLGHSVQDCSKRTLVYMGIFFIEAIKKSPGIKILSLIIFHKNSSNVELFDDLLFTGKEAKCFFLPL